MNKRQGHRAEVVVGGAGFAGLAIAIALRQGLGDPFTVTVADPAQAHVRSKDLRASAIAAAARRLFEAIGVWGAVAENAQPILDMVVTDSKLDDAARPAFLTFGGEVEEGEPFAHMIENRHLVDALAEKAKSLGVELRATPVAGFAAGANSTEVQFADGETITARLLVGADGARSDRTGRYRHAWMELRSVRNRHDGCAGEHNSHAEGPHLPAGPFAICAHGQALFDRADGTARKPIALSRCRTIISRRTKRFGLQLGDISHRPRRAFPRCSPARTSSASAWR